MPIGSVSGSRTLPFTLVAWQWQATFVPLSPTNRDKLFETVAEAARSLRRVRLQGFAIERESSGEERSLVVSNGGTDDPFHIEVTRDGIVYRSEGIQPLALRVHLERVTTPLLRACITKTVSERLLRTAHIYELQARLEPRARTRPNLDAITSQVAAGLLDRPWEAELAAPQLVRIDVTWGVEAKIAGARSTVWFNLEGAGDDDHTTIDANVQVQSASDELPSANWAVAVERIHDEAWPVITGLLTRLSASEATNGRKDRKKARTLSKQAPESRRRSARR